MKRRIGRTLGDFRIEERIGRGRTGVVYSATQLSLGRTVAVKVLDVSPLSGRKAIDRFRREIELVARLDHPNLVPVHAAGQEGDVLWFAMKRVDGPTLAAAMAEGLEAAPGLALLAGVADALAAVHAAGVVHRDVKPANVLIEGGRAYLTDFGVARLEDSALTSAGTVLGTLLSMAPEQAAGEPVGPAADLFAVGLIAHALALGRHPIVPAGDEGVSKIALLERIATYSPELPADLEPLVATVLARTLARDPADRYPDAHQLAHDLRAAAASR